MTGLDTSGRSRRLLTWGGTADNVCRAVSTSAFGIFAVLMMPAIVMYGSDAVKFQNGFLDPFVYLGYVHAFPELIARYGQTYYSARISYILVDRFFAILIDPTYGYVVFRYIVFVAASAVIYLIARRRAGPFVALFVLSWFVFVPWFFRSIAWTHYDGVATAYLILFLGVLLIPKRQGIGFHFAAGVFVALATNANMLLIGMAGLFVPSWIILNRTAGWRQLAIWGGTSLVGFAATYMVLNAIYGSYFPVGSKPFIEAASLRWTDQVFAGGSSQWVKPITELLQNVTLAGVFPLAFLILLVMVLFREISDLRKIDDFTLAAVVYSIAVVALYAALHVVVKTGVLGLFYYTIYLLPASSLVLIAIGRNLRLESRASRIGVLLATAAVVTAWLLQPLLISTVLPKPTLFWLGLFMISFATVVFPRVAALSAAALVGPWLLSMSLLSVTNQHYATRTMNPQTVEAFETDLFEAGKFLHDVINPLLVPGERVDFWYENTPRVGMDSVQSVYLWGYSRLHPCCEIGAGMPNLPAKTREALERASVLVLMADVPGVIDAGTAALRSAGIAFEEVGERHFQGRKFQMSLKIIRLAKN